MTPTRARAARTTDTPTWRRCCERYLGLGCIEESHDGNNDNGTEHRFRKMIEELRANKGKNLEMSCGAEALLRSPTRPAQQQARQMGVE